MPQRHPSPRAAVVALVVALGAVGPGCDKLKAAGGNATAEAESASDDSGADSEASDSEDGPKKKKKKKKKKATADANGTATAGVPAVPVLPPAPVAPTPAAPPAPAVNYFSDATSIPQKLKDKLGTPLRVYELNFFPEYSFAKLQDPKQPLHVDQYELRNGAVGAPTPVRFAGKVPTAAELAEVTFDIDEPNWSMVPQMVADAPKRLAKIEDASVTHVTVERPLPFAKEVRFRVYVDGPRASGFVEYDVHGTMRKVTE